MRSGCRANSYSGVCRGRGSANAPTPPPAPQNEMMTITAQHVLAGPSFHDRMKADRVEFYSYEDWEQYCLNELAAQDQPEESEDSDEIAQDCQESYVAEGIIEEPRELGLDLGEDISNCKEEFLGYFGQLPHGTPYVDDLPRLEDEAHLLELYERHALYRIKA